MPKDLALRSRKNLSYSKRRLVLLAALLLSSYVTTGTLFSIFLSPFPDVKVMPSRGYEDSLI